MHASAWKREGGATPLPPSTVKERKSILKVRSYSHHPPSGMLPASQHPYMCRLSFIYFQSRMTCASVIVFGHRSGKYAFGTMSANGIPAVGRHGTTTTPHPAIPLVSTV